MDNIYTNDNTNKYLVALDQLSGIGCAGMFVEVLSTFQQTLQLQ
jgi:hypothetical protein